MTKEKMAVALALYSEIREIITPENQEILDGALRKLNTNEPLATEELFLLGLLSRYA